MKKGQKVNENISEPLIVKKTYGKGANNNNDTHLSQEFKNAKDVAAKRNGKFAAKEASAFMKVSQSSKNSKTPTNKYQTSLVDNRSKSSAYQSSDSNFEKFVVPIVELRGRVGARSV